VIPAKRDDAFLFADTFGTAGAVNQTHCLATAFDGIWIQPSGDVGLTGIVAESMFLKGTLDLLDVEVRHREATAALVDDQFEQMVHAIAERRKLRPDDVRRLIIHG
jgi:protease IV